MPIKTNQEKATADTKRRIKKKVKKYKKRNRANATLTPQVARNTRADAAKYPAYTPFAYRPADSPTHKETQPSKRNTDSTSSAEHSRRRRQVSSLYTIRVQASRQSHSHPQEQERPSQDHQSGPPQ